MGGVLQLRIDDSDAARSRPDYIADIFETLQWLKFDWDAGPKSEKEFYKSFSQVAKKEEYRKVLDFLPHYPCSCSRSIIKKRMQGKSGGLVYDGYCRDHPPSSYTPVIRVQDSNPQNDIVLWTGDDMASYQLVSLIEDLAFGTTFILRGVDLIESTKAQLRLAKMLKEKGMPFLNAKIIHHPLLLDETGNKLSKSAGSSSIQYCRRNGYTPKDIFKELSKRAKWPFEITSLQDLLQSIKAIDLALIL